MRIALFKQETAGMFLQCLSFQILEAEHYQLIVRLGLITRRHLSSSGSIAIPRTVSKNHQPCAVLLHEQPV